jgi:hypothetical protein
MTTHLNRYNSIPKQYLHVRVRAKEKQFEDFVLHVLERKSSSHHSVLVTYNLRMFLRLHSCIFLRPLFDFLSMIVDGHKDHEFARLCIIFLATVPSANSRLVQKPHFYTIAFWVPF